MQVSPCLKFQSVLFYGHAILELKAILDSTRLKNYIEHYNIKGIIHVYMLLMSLSPKFD